MSDIEKVREIFEEYYGEDRVDLVPRYDGTSYIIVWFPSVNVTNENSHSVTIRDVFVRIHIYNTGKLRAFPEMARTTFTYNQAVSNYVHSHCSGGVPTISDQYNHLCFGTGPINRTMASLMASFDESLWTLFCGELDLYTKTESIEGVPYKRLESIGAGYEYNFHPSYHVCYNNGDSISDRIISYILRNTRIPVSYSNGMYNIALPELDYILLISAALDKYLTQVESLPGVMMHNIVIKNGKLYHRIGGAADVNVGINNAIYVTFKGRHVPLRIYGSTPDEQITTVRIAPESVITMVTTVIYRLINLNYGKGRKDKEA